jgi:hypothetical protein
MARWHRLALAALFSVGCNKSTISAVQPSIAVQSVNGGTLGALTFPLIAYDSSESQTIVIQSQSNADLQVSLALSGAQAADFSVSPSMPFTVPGTQSQMVNVEFAPPLPSPIPSGIQQASATLTVSSNDPNHPTIPVTLGGKAGAPELQVCWVLPDGGSACAPGGAVTADFGTWPPGVTSQPPQEIDVTDLNAVPLTLTSLLLDQQAMSAGFALVTPVSTPVTLSPAAGLSLALQLTLTPQSALLADGGAIDAGLFGHLLVQGNDPRLSGAVSMELAGAVVPTNPPLACIGVSQIDYVEGHSVVLDAGIPFPDQVVTPPGPLDIVHLTGKVSPECSTDLTDGGSLGYNFAAIVPAGSDAGLQPVAGASWEQTLQFDQSGRYVVSLVVTNMYSQPSTNNADAGFDVAPQGGLSALLTWQSPLSVDLDLHLVRVLDGGPPPGQLVNSTTEDCFFCNCLNPSNYSGGSPCDSPGTTYPTALNWGASASENPFLVASYRYQPFPSVAEDLVKLPQPTPGTQYDLYVHYYKASQGQADAGCNVDGDCTDPAYPSCADNECMPLVTATLQTFVAGREIDGGSPLMFSLGHLCDLWHAGTLQWIGAGVVLPDGGITPPNFIFVPRTSPSDLTNNQGAIPITNLTCPTL